MTRRHAGSFFVGIAATALAGSAIARTAEPKPSPLLVGVVDLGVVLERYQGTKDIMLKVQEEKARIADSAKEQRRALESLRKEIEATPENTPAYKEKTAELEIMKKGLEAMDAEAISIVQKRTEALTLQVIDEIEDGVRDFCKANKYDMIVKTTTKHWGAAGLPERLYRAQISTVVAYDPKLDVTESIIARLNDPERLKKQHEPRENRAD
jgi:Skp family chaperone for outer membrane proteins